MAVLDTYLVSSHVWNHCDRTKFDFNRLHCREGRAPFIDQGHGGNNSVNGWKNFGEYQIRSQLRFVVVSMVTGSMINVLCLVGPVVHFTRKLN
jgi:hypothetical protein